MIKNIKKNLVWFIGPEIEMLSKYYKINLHKILLKVRRNRKGLLCEGKEMTTARLCNIITWFTTYQANIQIKTWTVIEPVENNLQILPFSVSSALNSSSKDSGKVLALMRAIFRNLFSTLSWRLFAHNQRTDSGRKLKNATSH